jgi:hypothetical protein
MSQCNWFVQKNILLLQEVGTLIQEGGEESVYLVQDDIIVDTLTTVLETIKKESAFYQLA